MFYANYLSTGQPLKISGGCVDWKACEYEEGWAWEKNSEKFGKNEIRPVESHSRMEKQPFNDIFKYDQFEKKNEGIQLWGLTMRNFIRERGFWSDRVYHDESKNIPQDQKM